MSSAAVNSIIASGLLEQAEVISPSLPNSEMPVESSSTVNSPQGTIEKYASLVLRTWVTCIRLLEDEDDGIRQKLASSLQKCFTRKLTNDVGFFPRQVDKVIVPSFEYLSAVFCHWIEYFNHLSDCVYGTAKPQVSSSVDLVGRVFDKEIDYHHEDKLLICQPCCLHLKKLSISRPWVFDLEHEDLVLKFLYEWRTRFYQQLIYFSSENVLGEAGVDWIGGVGNHKAAFLPLYSNLLGFHTFSKALLHKEPGQTNNRCRLPHNVVILGESISPFLHNPLIVSLYSLVVDLHKSRLSDRLLVPP